MKELFLDVDGVILDFEGALVDFVRDEYINDLPDDYVLQSWEISDEFKSLDIEEVWTRFVNGKRFKRLDLLVDPTSFNKISSLYPIHFVTNIPFAQFDSRTENLNYHQLAYKQLHLAGHFDFGDPDYPRKSDVIKKIHQYVNEIVFLDDHPKNCQEIKEEFPESKVYLMSRPHNKDAENTGWVRVDDWNEFLDHVN